MRKQSSYGITKEDGNNIDDEISATQSEESTTGVNETIHEEITAASSVVDDNEYLSQSTDSESGAISPSSSTQLSTALSEAVTASSSFVSDSHEMRESQPDASTAFEECQ